MDFKKRNNLILIFGLGLIICLFILFFLPYQEVDRFRLTNLSASDGSIDGYTQDYILRGYQSVFFTLTNSTSILLLILILTSENKKSISVLGVVLTSVIIFLKLCWLLLSVVSQVFFIKTTPLLGYGLGFLISLPLLAYWIVCLVSYKENPHRNFGSETQRAITDLDKELGL